MRILFLIIGFALFSLKSEAAVFNPQSFTLKNGMQVVLIPNNRVPVVHHMVWYRVGSADEPAGKSGIAHYFEHLMFKGTKTRAPGEFSKIVAKNGGRDNAFTSYDYTGYFQTVAKDRLPLMMELEADRMTNLTLTAEVIEPERQVILEERRQRTDNNPGSQLREQISTVQYMNHPYRIPVIGWEHEIKGLTLNDLNTFYKKWYAPNNAVLVVEGDITLAELRPLAEKYYGVIPAGEKIERIRPIEPTQHADRRVTKWDERVRQNSIQRSYLAPSYGSAEEGDTSPYDLQVLENILGGGSTSRLYRSLVIDQKVADSAGFYYSPSMLDQTTITFWASPKQGVDIAVVEQAILNEIDLLLEKGVTQDEVMRAQKTLVNEAVFARDNLGTAAQVLGSSLAIGVTIDQIESWPDRIKEVNPHSVNTALRAVLKDKYSTTGVLLSKGEGS
ncbi:pitrilysin family protein [Terasakiella sp. A23]|uniref:M16 family metallopeptidase n=1 Tax=Terasakiella sp. FCG-A23 TaxID=3080561 RepID=UPI002953DB90|nr:pitrilysin family protein [Terasakiella sp. A23]MDV7338136.1 pitrilysin family protein [Terasakiella sp. A23]